MTGHLKLLGVLFNLFVGVILFVYIYNQKKRYYKNIFNSLLVYTSSIILAMVLLFLSKYWDMNISMVSNTSRVSIFENLSILFMYLILVTVCYSVIYIVMQFQKLSFPIWLKFFNFIIFSLILTAFVLFILSPPSSTIRSISDYILENFGITIIILEIFYLSKLLIKSKKESNKYKKRMQALFSLIFLSRYLVVFITVLFIPAVVRGFISLLFLHGLCFLWIKYFYIPYLKDYNTGIKNLRIVDQLNEMFKISDREKEILTLILKGKNNREIEELLFISYNTVKNHVYSIYKKIGIKNRFQLFKYIETFK